MGIFSIFSQSIHDLINLGSIHSYICMLITNEKELQLDILDKDIMVTNPLAYSLVVRKVFKDYSILMVTFFIVIFIEKCDHGSR